MKTEKRELNNEELCLLIKQYILNKEERKKIKKERLEYHNNNTCKIKGKISEGMKYTDCISDFLLDYCDVCKERHKFYLRLKKIQYENMGIMVKIRNTVLKDLNGKA